MITRRSFAAGSIAAILAARQAPAIQWAARNALIGGKAWHNPYVTDGLIAMWDGEWNAGGGVHDPNATAWKDLVGDIDFPTGNLQIGGNYVKLIGNIIDSGKRPPFSMFIESVLTVETNGVVYIDKATVGHRLWITDNAIGNNYYYDRPSIKYTHSGNPFSVSVPFTSDTYISETNSFINGQAVSIETAPPPYGYLDGSTIRIGAFGFVGKVYSIRLYSRALTADEIATNTTVDKARFNLP